MVVKSTDIFEMTVEGILSQPGAAFTVYKVYDQRNRVNMAIKMIPLTNEDKKPREIAILESLRGCPNIAQIIGSINTNFRPAYAFLTLEYVNCVSWYNIQSLLTLKDFKHYLHQLITALACCHDKKIAHRGVKPENLLIDPSRKHLQLGGWSNAVCLNSIDQFHFNPQSYPLLFYRAKDRVSQLEAIIKVVGNERIVNYVQSNNIRIDTTLKTCIFGSKSGNYRCLTGMNYEVMDLMVKLMTVDPFSRITAQQALSHPYFKNHCYDQTESVRFGSRPRLNGSSNSSTSTENAQYLPYFDYKFISCVGEGSFGEVHRVKSSFGGHDLAVKIMKDNNREDFVNECAMLEKLRGVPNVIKFYGSILTPKFAVLVFEFVDFTPWKYLYNSLKSTEIQYYIYNLLIALHTCHGLGIMHRDVKPSNLVINPARRQLRLVDWGQATYYRHGKDYEAGAGTRLYRSPEMHLGFKRYNFAVDMWSVGCVLASAVFHQRHFFNGGEKRDILLQITRIVGSGPMLDAIMKYDNQEFKGDKAFMNIEAIDFRSYINDSNKKVAIKSAVDLVGKLLVCDPEKRYTAAQALKHSYFQRARRFSGEREI
ncbi:unnamed protein product [Rodentolepis nana]|uniref:non-specific serine/threonine protein kinase n=1 Tax=Rodentolepis nana TaxID=102285 RepID=A0A0R3T0X7_RODNA|nr:unnamed protein product [Rodentolepis nana]